MKNLKLVGITKIRNEELIIQDTLDHFAEFCDGIYVYDDCSTDRTVEICKNHKAVKSILEGESWDTNRIWAETKNRLKILRHCQLTEFTDFFPHWIIFFDADERIEFDFRFFDFTRRVCKEFDAVRMRLFDFYITAQDVDKPYHKRRWMGPEYREIIMMFKHSPHLNFNLPDQREVTLKPNAKILNAGYVKHYGKAISVEEWEKTCDYYMTFWPEPYRSKWKSRKGKAIHTKSDFGRNLITWDEKDTKGVKM